MNYLVSIIWCFIVDPSDSCASNIRIQTSSGTKALAIYGCYHGYYSLNYLARDYSGEWHGLINNDIVIATDSYVIYSTTEGNWIPSPTITEDLRFNVVGDRNVENFDAECGFFARYTLPQVRRPDIWGS